MSTKKESQKRHAKRRFKTRLGLSLTQDMHVMLVKKIQKGEGTKVEKQSNRISVWDIPVSGLFRDNPDIDSVRVVYDSRTKNIVTTLFEDGAVI